MAVRFVLGGGGGGQQGKEGAGKEEVVAYADGGEGMQKKRVRLTAGGSGSASAPPLSLSLALSLPPPSSSSAAATGAASATHSRIDSSSSASSSSDLAGRAAERLERLHRQGLVGGASEEDGSGPGLRCFIGPDTALKPDHALRPLWVTPHGYIMLEAFSPLYQRAYDFVVAIAEPEARPELIHTYKLTPYSLYAAVAVSIDTEDIILVLDRLSKNRLPASVATFIRDCTVSYGKVKLVLRDNKFFVESAHPEMLRALLDDEIIAAARVSTGTGTAPSASSASALSGAAQAGRGGAEDGFTVSFVAGENQSNLAFRELGTLQSLIDADKRKKEAAAAAAAAKAKSRRNRGSGPGNSSKGGPRSSEDNSYDPLREKQERLKEAQRKGNTQLEAELEMDILLEQQEAGEDSDDETEQIHLQQQREERMLSASMAGAAVPPTAATAAAAAMAGVAAGAEVEAKTGTEAEADANVNAGDVGADTEADNAVQKPKNARGAAAPFTLSLLKHSEAPKLRKLAFQIRADQVEVVRRQANILDRPLMEEYDFKRDVHNPNLPMDLKPTTVIRPYQAKSLSKMFGNGRARSGIIVLPCGAGKTLTGVTAACTIKKNCIVMCNNAMAVTQWKEQFEMWTNIGERATEESRIIFFTANQKDPLPPPDKACILLTTYHMISFSQTRSEEGAARIQQISQREWGLMILDEVHVAPANKFRRVMSLVHAHCKLGLTATLVREDGLIEDLNFLIGPKLYEANWLDLTMQGFLANVQCAEIWCPMTPEFFNRYIRASEARRKRLLYVMNPAKFRACEFLMRYHEKRGDKVIIFCDDILALDLYSNLLKRPYIYGKTEESERQTILQQFKTNSLFNVVGLSKVGDIAIDIPEANVIIQVSSHFGSRRQEAQRLGRILRPKQSATGGGEFNAFFYTLVSTDTAEMHYSNKRQQYLVNQGYTFKIVQDLTVRSEQESEVLNTKQAEMDLLTTVMNQDMRGKDEAAEDRSIRQMTGGGGPGGGAGGDSDDDAGGSGSYSRKRKGTLAGLSGL